MRADSTAKSEEFNYLDDPVLRRKLVDFEDERTTRVTFRVPSVHCIACVWLLENLFWINPGIGYSQVNFPRKEIFITFENSRIKLGEVVALLTSLGYAPELFLSDLKDGPRNPVSRRLWMQLGVAGFAFGNIMLLTIDVPIALGISALAAWSTAEVLSGCGPGYFDSLAGLLFFPLCGKLFQQKTYDRLAFDRDYKSFFPLSILRKRGQDEDRIGLSQLAVGDRLVIRNGELIPSDSRLISGRAMIDYSFVTGESEPVEKTGGSQIYAGGRQIGGAIAPSFALMAACNRPSLTRIPSLSPATISAENYAPRPNAGTLEAATALIATSAFQFARPESTSATAFRWNASIAPHASMLATS